MILIYLLLLVGFSLLLIKATDILTESLQRLAQITKLGKFAITSLLLAFATSIPELMVGITAALGGNQNLALGVVLGSNIANLSLVVGGAAMIGGSLSVAGRFLKLDVFSVFLAGVMPLMLLLDKTLSRVDGIILLLTYGIYNYGILKNQQVDQPTGTGRFKLMLLSEGLKNKKADKWLAWLFLGAGMLMFSADMIVKLAVMIANTINTPVLVVGMFLIAVGAVLPELSFEAKAIRKGQAGMVLGNLTGSIVVNSTLVLGLVALINPIRLQAGLNAYLLAAAAFGVMFCLFWMFVKSKKKLERWEGLVLIAVYLAFAMLEWWKR